MKSVDVTKQAKSLNNADDSEAFELTDAQKRELDRRLESSQSNPGQGRTWDEIKAEFMKSRSVI